MNEKECWLCHRRQDEILKFAEDKAKRSDDYHLAFIILDSFEYHKDVFSEVDVIGVKITLCPVCYFLLESVFDLPYFEDKFDEQLRKYRFKGQFDYELLKEEGSEDI